MKFGPKNIGRIQKLAPKPGDSGPTVPKWDTFGHGRSTFGNTWRFGGEVCRHLANVGQVRPKWAKHWRILTEMLPRLGQTSMSKFGRCWSALSNIGPRLAFGGECGQNLAHTDVAKCRPLGKVGVSLVDIGQQLAESRRLPRRAHLRCVSVSSCKLSKTRLLSEGANIDRRLTKVCHIRPNWVKPWPASTYDSDRMWP